MYSMKPYYHHIMDQSLTANKHHFHRHRRLLMEKKNGKLKRYEIIGNEVEEPNIWYIGKDMAMNMTHGLPRQSLVMHRSC